ncbi:MAG: methyltransferase [Rhizobiaceae bacterium]|nr:methyltransferase [Rhizobiaceae bacterium]
MTSQPHLNMTGKGPESTIRSFPDVEYTTDRFHDGAFEVAQPAKEGHRAGLDALLLAASLKDETTGVLADLGAGCGTAGLAALNLHRELDLVAIELNEVMFSLLEFGLSRPGNSRFANRVQTLQADITLSGTDRLEQGIQDNSADHVIMNPPYNTGSYRPPSNAVKHEAYMLGEGGLDAWFRTACAMLRVGGGIHMIYRAEDLGTVIACSRGRFGNLQIIPIHSRADEPAKRILVLGVKGSRAPLEILLGFTVHNSDGSFTEHAEAIFKGTRRLLD